MNKKCSRWSSLVLISCMLCLLLPTYAMTTSERQVKCTSEWMVEPVVVRTAEIKTLSIEMIAADVTFEQITPQSTTTARPIREIFPDVNLAEAMAMVFGVSANTLLTQADLDIVIGLEITGWNIQCLDGIQFFRNLEAADFSYGRISNLTPLSGLRNLEWLALEYNEISDLQPLSELHRLTTLWLNNNRIVDLQPLNGLRHLRLLSLSYQRVTLPPAMVVNNSLVHESVVRTPDGRHIEPWGISNEGVWQHPNLYWTGLPAHTTHVVYYFHQGVGFNHRSTPFPGRVVVPLSNTPFHDVTRTNWHHNAVEFAFSGGLMTGLSATIFSPDTSLSRSMLVTVLYRIAGSPNVIDRPVFQDVPLERWYSAPVIWAFEQGIVQGISPDLFAPHADITREQFATMIHRFAKFMGHDATTQQSMQWYAFTDRDQIGSWAMEGLAWANYHGLITGRTPTTIAPAERATRAECATILMRYIEAFMG